MSGPLAGRPVTALFPAAQRGEIETRCRQALAGRPGRFSSGEGAAAGTFDVAPIRTADGLVTFGVLVSDALVDAQRRLQAVG